MHWWPGRAPVLAARARPATPGAGVLPNVVFRVQQGHGASGPAAITLYVGEVAGGDEQENENRGALDAIEADLGTLAGLRHQVQLAVDQALPWRTPGAAATRQAFLLPADRPLPG